MKRRRTYRNKSMRRTSKLRIPRRARVLRIRKPKIRFSQTRRIRGSKRSHALRRVRRYVGEGRRVKIKFKLRRFKIAYTVSFKIRGLRTPIIQQATSFVTTRKRHVTRRELLEKAAGILKKHYESKPGTKLQTIFFP